MFIKKAFAELN